MPKQMYEKEMQEITKEKLQFYEINKYMLQKQLTTLKNEFYLINSSADDLQKLTNSRELLKDINLRVNNLRTFIQKIDTLGADPTLLREQKKELAILISALSDIPSPPSPSRRSP